jgi:hypothetical protein
MLPSIRNKGRYFFNTKAKKEKKYFFFVAEQTVLELNGIYDFLFNIHENSRERISVI